MWVWEELRLCIFLRMNTIHNYNFAMGSVDAADQFSGTYRFDHSLRNMKWW